MAWLPTTSIILLAAVAVVAVSLSVMSYQYSTAIASEISEIGSQDIRSNAAIEAHDLSRIFVNKIESVMDNLQVIATTQSVKNQDLERAKELFSAGQSSTDELTDSYFWIDQDGELLWANAFSNQTIYEQFRGADRSDRAYYLEPRDTRKPYISALIESVDGVPRLYVSYPVVAADQSGNNLQFRGVVVAASNLDELGQFLKSQLSPAFESEVGLVDRAGTILYSQVPELIGKHVSGPELQAVLPAAMRETFNSIMDESLQGRSGSGDFTYLGNTSTIAYQPVSLNDNEFGVLYIITSHEVTSTSALIEQHRTFTTVLIVVIGAVAFGIAALILVWNNGLSRTVADRTLELAQSNESLKQAIERLKVNDKLQKEFINVAAHELRTPVQPLLGLAEMLGSDLGNEDKLLITRAEVEMIVRNAKRLERLSSDILAVSRIESNSLQLHKELVDLNEKMQNVIMDAKPFLTFGKKIDIVFESTDQHLIVEADRTRIFEVLSNLITNAIKFTEEGMILIKLQQMDHHAMVSVSDTGRGIDPEIMPKLFGKFVTNSESGTGLGLFISKSIVEAHGGKIWAENNVNGKGATFYFTLPLRTVDLAEQKIEESIAAIRPDNTKDDAL